MIAACHRAALLQPLREAYGFSDLVWGELLGGLSSQNMAFVADGSEYALKCYGPGARAQLARLEQLAVYLSGQNFSAPVPLLARSGQRHIAVDEAVYAVSRRCPGRVLHQGGLTTTGLESAAMHLHRLHGLGAGASAWLGAPRAPLAFDAASHAHATLRERIAARHLQCEHRDLISESLALKQEVLSSLDPMPSIVLGVDFVHGDFHNENLLFDTHHQVTCVMDYEESGFGCGAIDVVNFIQFACCNDGFGSEQLQRAQTFIRAYSAFAPLTGKQVQIGWDYFFWRLSASIFMEERLADDDAFFVTFTQRDIHKMRAHLQHGADLLRAILPWS